MKIKLLFLFLSIFGLAMLMSAKPVSAQVFCGFFDSVCADSEDCVNFFCTSHSCPLHGPYDIQTETGSIDYTSCGQPYAVNNSCVDRCWASGWVTNHTTCNYDPNNCFPLSGRGCSCSELYCTSSGVAPLPPPCNAGTQPGSCGTCNSTAPFNRCGVFTGSQTCTHNSYSGYPACACTTGAGAQFANSCPAFDNNCNAAGGYACINNNTCVTNIFVHVYTDYDHSATQNGADTGKQGVTITDNGGNFPTTDSNGNVTFTQKAVGNYTITETVPANFQATNATSQVAALTNNAGNATINFYLTPLYSISGRVFNDTDKNQRYDSGDTGYGGGTIHITGPTAVTDMTAAGDGTWATPTNLLSGTYTVSYTTSLATGYTFTTPSTYSVTVGDPTGSPDCATGGSLDATCGGTNNGSIASLNVGLTNENAWEQSVCFDVRDDSGSYTDLIPAAPSCGGVTGNHNAVNNGSCSTGAGIIFTCDATPDFGLGDANANLWQAGGAGQDQECFTGAGLDVIRTSYEYLTTTMQQSGITPTDMASIGVCGAGGLSSCVLNANLPRGVYQASGDVHLTSAYTFPVDPLNPQGFIFLINGDMYIEGGNILVPAGSVAAFSTSGNIYIDKSIGNIITNTSSSANNDPNIEGLYSADASFIIQSYGSGANICNADGTPLDKKLNIVGSVIANAAKAGGSILNNRDLCIYDLQCPSFSVGDDDGLAISYLLTLLADGKFLTHKVFNWEELRP